MTKKNLKVKDILALMNNAEEVTIIFYAYGIYYGSNQADNVLTVKECLEELRNDCLNAIVTQLTGSDGNGIEIHAEMVND